MSTTTCQTKSQKQRSNRRCRPTFHVHPQWVPPRRPRHHLLVAGVRALPKLGEVGADLGARVHAQDARPLVCPVRGLVERELNCLEAARAASRQHGARVPHVRHLQAQQRRG